MAKLDRSTGRLIAHRSGADRIVFLDEDTLTLIAAWIRERTLSSPRSANPHLLASQSTATTTKPLSRTNSPDSSTH